MLTPEASARIIRTMLATQQPSATDLRATIDRHRREHAASLRSQAEVLHARCGFARASELFAQADEIDPRGGAQ